MTRRTFFQIAGTAGALVGVGALPGETPDLQAILDAGGPLPGGVHVVTRTLQARGAVSGAGSGTTLVAGPALRGPIVAGAPFVARNLVIQAGGHTARFGAGGASVTRLG